MTREVDITSAVRAYRDTRVVEVRLPKPDLKALRERGMSVEDAVRSTAAGATPMAAVKRSPARPSTGYAAVNGAAERPSHDC